MLVPAYPGVLLTQDSEVWFDMNWKSTHALKARILVSILTLLAAISTSAASYKISGSADGAGTFVVDDGLAVYLNGVQIYSDGSASSGERQPISINANVGDQLRFAVHDTYGDCSICCIAEMG